MTKVEGRQNLEIYLKIEELKDRYTYFIRARNAKVGIWISERNSFVISRFKFSSNYLFEEFHWDTGSPYGTVKPIQEIEKSPGFSILEEVRKFLTSKPEDSQEVLEYLNKKEEELNKQ